MCGLQWRVCGRWTQQAKWLNAEIYPNNVKPKCLPSRMASQEKTEKEHHKCCFLGWQRNIAAFKPSSNSKQNSPLNQWLLASWNTPILSSAQPLLYTTIVSRPCASTLPGYRSFRAIRSFTDSELIHKYYNILALHNIDFTPLCIGWDLSYSDIRFIYIAAMWCHVKLDIHIVPLMPALPCKV